MATTEAVAAAIGKMVSAVNAGDIATALAAFTDHPVIIEDIAPYRWDGAGAAGEWLKAMGENAQRLGVSAIAMELLAPIQVQADQGRAYAAYTGRLTMTMQQAAATADGQLTFTLVEQDGGWRIESLVWSGPQPS